jgi:hypothetical protein
MERPLKNRKCCLSTLSDGDEADEAVAPLVPLPGDGPCLAPLSTAGLFLWRVKRRLSASLREDYVMRKWRVDVFRKRLLQLGTVTAPNAQEALTQAYNLFRLDPEYQERLTITKIEELKPKRTHPSRRHMIG